MTNAEGDSRMSDDLCCALDAAIVRRGSMKTPHPAKNRKVGFAYVLSNLAMPGMVKVGFSTEFTAEDRAKQLYTNTTGVPLPFVVEFTAETSFPKAAEAAAHKTLDHWRVSPDREFFRVQPWRAAEEIRFALLDECGLDTWSYETPHFIRRGDRVALTLQAGDTFVILACSSPSRLVTGQAEPIDLWQAHSDGDLLELMGVRESAHVAGLSDGDDGAEIDPVPFLDLSQTMPNGVMNGRERLVPGDRLLWLRPPPDGIGYCKLAIFEMLDYCQVVSRTWDPKLTADGWPLLLEYPTVDEQPECVIRTTLAVMRQREWPRNWTERNPDHGDWAKAIRKQTSPEFWLTQLAKVRRSATKRAITNRSPAKRSSLEQLPLWPLDPSPER